MIVVLLAGEVPSAATQARSGGALPDGPIEFRFSAHANNVRVLPPLVGEWQLGVSRLSGRGEIRDGAVTGTFTDTDDLTRGTRSLTATIEDGTFVEVGGTRRLTLTVRITRSSHPADECAPGLTGLLELQDSPDPLPGNGQPNDFVRLTGWSGDCRTHVHGWNNEDPGPRTNPPTGGPPSGGQWADVEIGGAAGPGRVATLGGADRAIGGATAGAPLDLIVAFDLTASMGASIESMKRSTVDLVRRARAASPDFRLGLVTFRDSDADAADAFEVRPLGSVSATDLEAIMAGWEAKGGGDHPEDMAEALSRAIAMWEGEGSTARKPVKLVVVVTDAPGKWPDGFGNTRESIARRAFEVDPAHVYPVVVGENPEALADAERIAAATGGRMLRAEDGAGVADAVIAAVEGGVAAHAAEVGAAPAGGGGPVAGRRGRPDALWLLLGGLGFLAVGAAVALLVLHGRRASASGAGIHPIEMTLEIVAPGTRPRRVTLHAAPAVLGRDPSCDLVLADPAVGRRHARVVVANRCLFLEDLGSSAGIRVDGRAVRLVELRTGTRLLLGDTRIVVA